MWAPRAWLPEGWRDHVLLRVGQDGCWAEVIAGVARPPEGALVLDRPILPGLVNAHSHAFQRAFAGMAERSEAASDDFWSWRDRMYGVALRITPAQLRAVAAQLFVELLRGGYTQVCEFHYLQHDVAGLPYADPLTLAWAVADAATDTGIGLTLLPVLYERAGFTDVALRPDQRRFATTPTDVGNAARRISASGRAGVDAGLAIHSLRAASAASIRQLCHDATAFAGPIHVHVAEQLAEVDDCRAATGARPIEWLVREGLLDARWQLVHATHATQSEIDAVARSGAGVVICPSTEANLGDGLPDLPAWLAARVPLAVGSDSQVTRDWREELRWLDYGQRLTLRRRNVAASPQTSQFSTAARLFGAALDGGAAAAGKKCWGLRTGARADALLPDPHDAALHGVPATHWLDSLVFTSPGRPWRDVMVAGRWVICDHQHAAGRAVAHAFSLAMEQLWA
jgi:formimidoylglutamate deiminase